MLGKCLRLQGDDWKTCSLNLKYNFCDTGLGIFQIGLGNILFNHTQGIVYVTRILNK